MNSKRSYLDTLNAGRQRKPHATLEQLNRSLESLEQRLETTRREATQQAGRAYSDEPGYASNRPYDQPRANHAAYGAQRPFSEPRPSNPAISPDAGYQAIARDIDRVRGQEDGVAMASKIAGELRGLREELRHQMTTGLRREFEALHKDIAQAVRSGPADKGSAGLGLEFERLSSAVQSLSEKSDDRATNLLRLELEQVKGALDTLAREESVQAVDRRWDDFDRRWSAFESRIDNGGKGDGPAFAMLSERLEQIGQAVNNLPESLSLRSLEEKVRTLGGAVERFIGQQGGRGGDTLPLIDERLDEISRAIVASTVAAQANAFDPEAFERIERRIASLAEQIEEVAADRPTGEAVERLNALSHRVDELAARAQFPEQAIERLGQQIAQIAERIDRAPATPDADYIFQGLEQRFDVLSGMMERRQGDAIEQGNMLFHDLERRLDEVVDRLDRRMPDATFDSAGIMDVIDARFTALAMRLDSRQPDPAGDAVMRGLESRLEDISSRLDTSAGHIAGIDPDLIRSLEAQVAGLSNHLSKPGTPLPEFEDINPRLEEIEKSLAGTRDTILDAAREAAANAVRAATSAGVDTAAVSGLAQDLKTLEALTRRSDERNSRTFEAIHDTLLKIVDRLGSLETEGPAEPAATPGTRAPKIAVQDAPALDMDDPLPLGRQLDERGANVTRTPAEAAAEAALAALGSDTDSGTKQSSGGRKSMLGGLARAFGGKKEPQVEPALAEADSGDEAPTVDLDAPLEPKFINRPLEPGSGGPDLTAIMKRVRDERGQTARQAETDPAKSDFIAAARRAAQAAAAEAETMKRQSAASGPVKALRIGDLLRARRKPLLMAAGAIMLALAGLQLGKAFLSAPEQVASNEPQPASVAQVAQVKSSESAKPVEAVADDKPVRIAEQTQPAAPNSMAAQDGDVSDEAAENTANTMAEGDSAADMQAADRATTDHEMTSALPSVTQASLGVTPDVATTIDVPTEIEPAALREAASADDAKALFEIGSRYADGRGVKEDMAAAAKWYEKAANLGFAPAEYRIGNFYEKGLGVERDIEKAKTWYQMAAEQGNASAMHNLAVLFAMAADGVTDNDSAAHWFQAAADLGVKDSQFNLGILAAKGVGMKQNLEEAYKWFALVARTGDKDASAKRDEIANALRPEQLERARAAAELWKAKPVDPAANSADIPAEWQGAPTTTASVDMKKAVQNIQRILNKNGYASGGADGVMGEKTKNAIMAFQGDNGLTPTGEVDDKLVRALLAHK